MRTTHTCALLELSPSAYAEIRSKLEAAGYQHAFEHENDGGEWIDMSGIGVQSEPALACPECGAAPRREHTAAGDSVIWDMHTSTCSKHGQEGTGHA